MKTTYKVYDVVTRVQLVSFSSFDSLNRWMEKNCERTRKGEILMKYSNQRVAVLKS